MSQKLSSAAVMIGALKINSYHLTLSILKTIIKVYFGKH